MIINSYTIGSEAWHGTGNGYTTHACRCDACREAWTSYSKQARKERAAKITPDDPRHGTDSFYCDHGCRCDQCRRAHADRERERAARRKARQAT